MTYDVYLSLQTGPSQGFGPVSSPFIDRSLNLYKS